MIPFRRLPPNTLSTMFPHKHTFAPLSRCHCVTMMVAPFKKMQAIFAETSRHLADAIVNA